MKLMKDIRRIAGNLEGTMGMAIKHLETGEQVLINEDVVFPTGSVFKIYVLAELFKQVKEGKINLNDKIKTSQRSKIAGSGILKELDSELVLTVKDLAMLMITISDNTATDLLLNSVGIQNVNATIREVGLVDTTVILSTRELVGSELVGLNHIPAEKYDFDLIQNRISRRQFDQNSRSLQDTNNNVSTPWETLVLLEKIAKGTILDRESCDQMLSILKRCQHNNSIPLLLPLKEVEIAHKTGNLPGIRADVGIVYMLEKQSRYILSAFVKKMPIGKEAEGELAIARVSKLVYDRFSDPHY